VNKTLLLCFSIFFSAIYCASLSAQSIKVAIVIDDMGYRYTDKQALNLPGNITYAVLPHTTFGKKLAIQANKQQSDVILHIPMEAETETKLGPGALTSTMSEQAIYNSLTASFNDIPHAIGVNNHMGSHLTKLYKPMKWTMSFLKERELFFLDSKTSVNSKATQAANDMGVPVNSRNVFLDNELTDQYINKQFNHFIQYAKKQKFAIAIAHPHPETVKILTKLIPTLKQNNIELVPLSSLYEINNKPNSTLLISD
jgi:polysaccharide deacetylase 2 family uncharacterized protein YibQ